jgi:hypothetical protein
MSALCHNRTYAPQQKAPLFDYFVGDGEQAIRHRQAERFGSFEVKHQIELGRLHNRQVLALENPANMNSGATIRVRQACAIDRDGGGRARSVSLPC